MNYTSIQSGFQTTFLIMGDKIEMSEWKASWLHMGPHTHERYLGMSPHSRSQSSALHDRILYLVAAPRLIKLMRAQMMNYYANLLISGD